MQRNCLALSLALLAMCSSWLCALVLRHLFVATLHEQCRDCCLLAAALPCGWPHLPPHLGAAAEEWQPLVALAGDYWSDPCVQS